VLQKAIMKCAQYREAIAAEPFAHGAAHANGCFPCRKFRDEIRALDTWIAAALAIDVAPPSLASEVIAHMDHEQESRQVTTVAVSEQALGNIIGSDVSAIETGGSLVTYARSCVINNKTVPHLVIQGKDGPVTLILMPEEAVDAAIPLSREHVHGVIMPVGGGSVAIIGERADQLNEIDAIGRRLLKCVKWRI
jgi:hypothetical protein